MTHRLVAALADVPTGESGEPTLAAALSTLLRISKDEAHRRIHEAQELGPRAALTGEALEPVLAHTAAAQRRGDIGAAARRNHLGGSSAGLPGFVDFDTGQVAEAQLAGIAGGLKPEELRQAADRLAILLDQDGELSDGDRARRRYLTVGKQGPDGMSRLNGWIDPETRAYVEASAARRCARARAALPATATVTDDHPMTARRRSRCLMTRHLKDSGSRPGIALSRRGPGLSHRGHGRSR